MEMVRDVREVGRCWKSMDVEVSVKLSRVMAKEARSGGIHQLSSSQTDSCRAREMI
jgi:hypothetical protein